MGKTYDDVKAIKDAPSKLNSLTKANDRYNEMVKSGKIVKRGNNILTLNEQISKIKLKYSI
ncbi:hypothetical protein C4F49_04480 [Sphingobacterium sp. KB22]|uniref:Uncharacterized protein n=1 Tax=Sphingobacterium hungaricum TaxID=2082723 RepID=A0A928UU41_9SPHI|nr:hypothetical protein [Sphingobacterium hungaricum]